MLMNNENDHSTSYRRLSDSTPSPILRRSKSVRASFRMLGSRWKSSVGTVGNMKIDSATGPAQKCTKDAVSERFGKDFNRNVKQPMTDPSDRLSLTIQPLQPPPLPLPPPSTITTTIITSTSSLPQSIRPIKAKTKFFHAFAKENVDRHHIQYEIPKNVAPKAAALLQIPMLAHSRQHPMNGDNVGKNIQQHKHRKNHDLIKMDDKFNVHLDRNSCNLIANSNQFAVLKSLSENGDTLNSQDMFKAATIRRAPYWLINQPFKYSKNFD